MADIWRPRHPSDARYITDTGNVCKGTANEKVGQLQSSGTIDSSVGSKLGSINGNDFYDSKSNRIGSFSGKGVYVGAALASSFSRSKDFSLTSYLGCATRHTLFPDFVIVSPRNSP